MNDLKKTQTIAGVNIMGVLFMLIAIWLGTSVGGSLTMAVGLGGGLIGSFIAGFVVYLIYALLSGFKLELMSGLIFAIMVWLATTVAGLFAFTGIIGLFITAIILSFLWGAFGKGKRKK